MLLLDPDWEGVMNTIEIDDDVLAKLKSQAEPFVDRTPNDVLRRILGLEEQGSRRDWVAGTRKPGSRGESRRRPASGGTEAFIRTVLEREFGGRFGVRSPYRTMYQDADRIVYFQNFNRAGTSNLWYRLKGTALETLTEDGRDAFVTFTNPAERFAYVIPIRALEERVKKVGWDREDLEVNIDPATDRWRELDWDLSGYVRRYAA